MTSDQALQLALRLALEYHWKVFPLTSSKTPFAGSHAHLDASDDPETIQALWGRWPGALVGIAARESGLLVVDVDVNHRDGISGFASLEEAGIAFDTDEIPCQRTKRGGMHFLFAHPNHDVPSKPLLPGVDIKSKGFFITGDGYTWIHQPNGHYPEVPEQLQELIRKASTPNIVMNDKDDGYDLPEFISSGERNVQLTRYAGWLRWTGKDGSEILRELSRVYQERCDHNPPLDLRELERIATGIANRPPGLQPTLRQTSDYVVFWLGDRIRYNKTRKLWYVWDGKRWAEEPEAVIIRMLNEVIPKMYAEIGNTHSDDERQKLSKWVSTIDKSLRYQKDILEHVKSHPRIMFSQNSFDSEPYLLNVNNGTLDLRDGRLRPHNPDDLITKISQVDYVPGMTHPIWDAQVNRFVDGNYREYVQRGIGSSLYPRASKKPIFFIYGVRDTGKTTFLKAVAATVGKDYTNTSAASTFVKATFSNPNSARNDLAALAGKRLVIIEEMDDLSELDLPLLKKMTGGGSVPARFLYGEIFELEPAFTLWFASNYMPKTKISDDAFWGRMKVIEFNSQLRKDEIDPHFEDKLQTPEVQQAILAWLVEGCLAEQKYGLQEPEVIEQTTTRIRYKTDTLIAFIDSGCCTLDPTKEVLGATFNKALNDWAALQTLPRMSPQEIRKGLEQRGVVVRIGGHGNIYQGVEVHL